MPFLTGWTKKKVITIPAAYITGSLVNFPLSVQIVNDAQIGAAAKADGTDLRFTLSDGTTLTSLYRRSFSIAGGLANGIFDVLLPSGTSGVDASLDCQYANASAPDVSSSAAVWGASGAGAVLIIPDPSDGVDVSGNGNNGTPTNGVSAGAGIVGGCGSLIGASNQHLIQANCNLGLNGGTKVSLALWIKNSTGTGRFVHKQVAEGWNTFNLLFNAGKVNFSVNQQTSGQYPTWETTGVINNNAWRRIIVSYSKSAINATDGAVYIDGSLAATTYSANGYTSSFTLQEISSNLLFGIRPVTFTDPFTGLMDEPAIYANTQLSPAFANLDFNQIANQSNVVLWGDEESASTPGAAYRNPFRRSFSHPFAGAFGA